MSDPIRVLVADDNVGAGQYLQRLLDHEEGIVVLDVVDNGLKALELVREQAPHIVLMDLNMPVMDGMTALEHIKREVPETQVIIITVQDDVPRVKQAEELGAFDYIVKPLMPEELVGLIARAYTAYLSYDV